MADVCNQRMVGGSRRAFSLVELLTVLFIIALVIAILIPAVSGARNNARRAATLSMLANLSNSAKQFELDNRRAPGYFSAARMGSAENATRGFTAMKNVMLDLAGGITQAAANPGGGIFDDVGPVAAETVTVDVGQIGAPTGRGAGSTKSYFAPDRAFLSVQNLPGQLVGTAITAGNRELPELVDSWGNPVLAWVADDRAAASSNGTGLNTANDGFAAMTSGTGPAAIARFYWNSNASLLSSSALGKRARPQNFASAAPNAGYSLIGAGRTDAQIVRSLSGILGNPAYPRTDDANRPAEPLGKVIFHSPGADGWFLGSQDRGGKVALGSPERAITYRSGFDPKPEFDDVIVSGGN